MTTRICVLFLFGCAMLSSQIPEWDGEHRVFDNPFYISPWPTNAEEAAQVTREQVVDFLSHIGIPHFQDGKRDLQEFQFASLAERKMHLVAVIQSGGTIGANLILIAHCDAAKCVDDNISSDPPIDLMTVLASAGEDGVKQLLTLDRLGGLGSLMHMVATYELYELGPKGPEKVTVKYRDWIRTRLERQKVEMIRTAADESEREILRAASDYALALFNDRREKRRTR